LSTAVALPPAACRLFGDPGAAAPGAAARGAVAPGAAAGGAASGGEMPRLDAAAPDPYVLARLLEDGDRADLAWLCGRFSAADLAAWIERHGARRLSRRSLAFWAVTLGRADLLPERRAELARRRELWPL
jgi:hypothetical protein